MNRDPLGLVPSVFDKTFCSSGNPKDLKHFGGKSNEAQSIA